MNIRPIPRKLLIHTVIYEEYLGDEAFGESFGAPITVGRVLVQPLHKMRRDPNGEEVEIHSVIFIDSVNTPLARPFVGKSKVNFNGEDLRVVSCEPLYTLNPDVPHHYEVTLV